MARLRTAVLCLTASVAVLCPVTSRGSDRVDFRYRVDLTRRPAEVVAHFPVRERKDFAFLTTMSGQPVRNLKVRDARGERAVQATDTPGLYRVSGLAPGMVEASYTLQIDPDCGRGSCQDDHGAMFTGASVLLHPMGVDPEYHSPARIELVMPTAWSLVSTRGERENEVTTGSLAALGALPILAGDQFLERTPGGEMLVIPRAGWHASPEAVGTVLAAFLREHERLLGGRGPRDEASVLRVLPGAMDAGALTLISPRLGVLMLPARAERQQLAMVMVRPLGELFQHRLQSGLAGAQGPATRWWREGFTEYTTLLAAVRSRALSEDRLIARLRDAWLNVSRHSPLARRTSLVEAGAMEGPEADAFVRDGGLLACFLLDVRLRRGSGYTSGLGELLAATRGRQVDNALLRREASRLARADMGPLLTAAVGSTEPPPLAAEAVLAGLELIDAGTGEPYLGLELEPGATVIARVADAGPARARGLKAGDRIVSIDGMPLAEPGDLEALLNGRRPGEPLEVSVLSEKGDSYTAVLELWERVEPTLRRVAQPSLAAANAWLNLTRGDATTFVN